MYCMTDSLPPSSPPVLREEHQKCVLSLMTRSHLILMDDLCQIFKLHSADVDLLLELVHRLLAEGKRKAVTNTLRYGATSFESSSLSLSLPPPPPPPPSPSHRLSHIHGHFTCNLTSI